MLRNAILCVVALALTGGIASAETVKGSILKIDADGMKITVKTSDGEKTLTYTEETKIAFRKGERPFTKVVKLFQKRMEAMMKKSKKKGRGFGRFEFTVEDGKVTKIKQAARKRKKKDGE